MFPPTAGGRTLFLSDVPDKIGVAKALPKVPNSSADTGLGTAEPAPSILGPAPSLDHEAGAQTPEARREPDGTDSAFLAESSGPSLARFSEALHGPPDPADSLFLEAVNPVPPHLRGVGSPLRLGERGPNRSRRENATPKSVCASCSKVVVTLRMSGPCPKCLRPICNECLREAFVTHGQGWCIDCSSTPPISAS
ncbi:MAG: hypothetical protein WB788_06065 [Thermoplasmata archaeon]|nr:hypothetical protein [Thermoplasmata archaeon]